MAKRFPTNDPDVSPERAPDGGPGEASPGARGRGRLDRLTSFRTTYIAIFAFLVLDVFTVRAAEWALQRYFEATVAEATSIQRYDEPVAVQIQTRLAAAIPHSRWVEWGGVRVTVLVLGRDGATPIYLGGHIVPPAPDMTSEEIAREADRLLPASSSVQVSVPFNSLLANGILVVYAAALVQVLFVMNRRLARREGELVEQAVSDREALARRAEEIERELDGVRDRLLKVEPAEREHAEEIRSLQGERAALSAKLAELAAREEELRRGAARAHELDQERQALEELLEEASSDLSAKDQELADLQTKLRRAAKSAGKSGRGREAENVGRRLRTLYKNLEVDDRAVDDIVALGDESTKLRAEEALKRLSDEADNVAIRRKVGGLPPHLSIFELGFAGKGRIYYSKGRQRRFRILLVGAKNSQKPDLEYLSRLPRSDFE